MNVRKILVSAIVSVMMAGGVSLAAGGPAFAVAPSGDAPGGTTTITMKVTGCEGCIVQPFAVALATTSLLL